MEESRGSSDQEDEQIVQVREALMCPDGEKFESLRTARFLNYTTASIDDDVFDLPLDAFVCRPPEGFDPTAKISFPGWGTPSLNWIEWVNVMAKSHATVWKKSGVYDAILASRYQIKRHDDLIVALVEKWCIETNTFVFPWGEATLTLEDMIVLGGLSVTGNNALAPVKRDGMKEVEEKMKEAKRYIEVSLEKKCCVSMWMKEMMNSGNEIEHEAFMVSWLSRFVFTNSGDVLREKLFPAAVQLAKGVRLALAPAVLARIYGDLGVLKEFLTGYSEKETVVVKSPFQFVQVWALERFMALQPPGQPSQLKTGEPRIARWHHYGGGQDVYGYPENIRAVLDSAKESFDYRPYTKPVNNFRFPKFYFEDDCWVRVRPDENIVAFGRCLRFAKLVGLDCIEPYYPHRVALQFGYDQDVPGVVPARIETPELAWKDYIRPIADGMLYFPARLHEADVTVGYIRWWKLSVAVLQLGAEKIFKTLLASHSKQKPVTTTTTAATTPTKVTKKISAAKAEGKDQEVVKKREIETKRETSVTGSSIEVSRADGRSHGSSSYAGSLTGSEQATKHPFKKPEWVQRSSHRPKKSPDRSSDEPEWVETSSARSTKSPARSSDNLKWVQRSSPRSTKSPDRSSGRAADDVKDLKGALRGSGGTKSQGHVTFQLPSSPGRSPSKTHTFSPKQSDSPVKKPNMLPRVADLAKQSSSSPWVPRHTSSVAHPPKQENYIKHHNSTSSRVSKESNRTPSVSSYPLKRKTSQRSPEAINSRGQKNPPSPRVSKEPYMSSSLSVSSSSTRKKPPRSHEAANSRGYNHTPSLRASKEPYKSSSLSGSSSTRKKPPRSHEASSSRGYNHPPSPRVSKELNKTPSISGSPSATRNKSPRSSENVNSCGNSSSGGNSVVKRNTDTSIIVSKQESPIKTQLDISKANKLLEEVVTLREQVGEDGEVTYQIPKQQFEDLSKGVHNVLHDLQSIKFALNIQDNDDA
ncbi:serine/threonine-protein phosphatase 7 long form-like protein [Arabidopsis thaliana]|uniref:Serine/threonine-protein phosphatase 7 long form-like protein n=1 Tax=Arabidopsis thaliana TaxID=3702 RepID=F4ICK6_ARATH|nr:serine/threonine-protein phosphatase 7 long form-like protein [Arabidopsis thaliana]AEE31437.2 serine/threonine-protein phosphatase 7 long form-like protein [Arabidopsis thaliana]|eukprot:NP_174491.2 serine/threonine-protein phosphatase 7 long form-like protein [Arabidopsis thaliana]